MKILNKYGFAIAVIVFVNILIFSFLSKHLESFVSESMANSSLERLK